MTTMYGLGDDGATQLDYPPSGIAEGAIGTGLTPCSSFVTAPGFVGPINCDATGGPVNYTPAAKPMSAYLPWVLVALVVLVAGPALIGGGEELKRLPLLRNAMIEDRSTEKAERR